MNGPLKIPDDRTGGDAAALPDFRRQLAPEPQHASALSLIQNLIIAGATSDQEFARQAIVELAAQITEPVDKLRILDISKVPAQELQTLGNAVSIVNSCLSNLTKEGYFTLGGAVAELGPKYNTAINSLSESLLNIEAEGGTLDEASYNSVALNLNIVSGIHAEIRIRLGGSRSV